MALCRTIEHAGDDLIALHGEGTYLGFEQSAVVRELLNTAMIVAIDLGVADDWHPANKAVLGERLEAAALNKFYGRDVIASGPQLAEVNKSQGSLILSFTGVGSGLVAQDAVSNQGKYQVNPYRLGFAIAGEDHCFVWATARITANHVELSALEVPHPVDVRYAWAAFPLANLANVEGFPQLLFVRTICPQGTTASAISIRKASFVAFQYQFRTGLLGLHEEALTDSIGGRPFRLKPL